MDSERCRNARTSRAAAAAPCPFLQASFPCLMRECLDSGVLGHVAVYTFLCRCPPSPSFLLLFSCPSRGILKFLMTMMPCQLSRQGSFAVPRRPICGGSGGGRYSTLLVPRQSQSSVPSMLFGWLGRGIAQVYTGIPVIKPGSRFLLVPRQVPMRQQRFVPVPDVLGDWLISPSPSYLRYTMGRSDPRNEIGDACSCLLWSVADCYRSALTSVHEESSTYPDRS
ncbi:hypothetical protein QBC33DRAFT_189908 [Phialemonium atrogriseum]|uniref:Uncharacterized protein n=1 Tax=Phialemonium atrogriseum TaxID=1093897 RepID=A0AAJ0FEP6_9PEZI|nr:uncharacterized protein QBC33DRAFT_189908 [Phialemonium atrogriseum]KAK1764592.1 hypothetical protein QBC33DRAFT_189908 [Phialemonium atrogriseum]